MALSTVAFALLLLAVLFVGFLLYIFLQPPQSEVYAASGPNGALFSSAAEAQARCRALGAQPATLPQLIDAWSAGAQWCQGGWLDASADPVVTAALPVQVPSQCPGVTGALHNVVAWTQPTALATCYGVKPKPGTTQATDVVPFNAHNNQWFEV